MVRPPGVLISFLQEKNVGPGAGQKLDYAIEVQTPVDIPADNPDGVSRKDQPAGCDKGARLDLFERAHGLFPVSLGLFDRQVRFSRP
jgi:hypothetical protein